MFRKYEKIHRLGKEEVDGILLGTCYVQEKIDGANTSIWYDSLDGYIRCGSRSKEVKEGFNGFVDYIQTNDSIKKLITDHPSWILYGEWLVRHTISYNNLSYGKWYMFDIWDGEKYLMTPEVDRIASEYGIPHPQLFGTFENPKEEELKKFVGQTNLGERGEGIVIKNPDFVDKFGSKKMAKIVTQEFKEDNGLIFGGNNKHSETYWEMYIVNKYMTLPRIQKMMNKIQPLIEKKLDMEHASRISGSAFKDMLDEEIWDISRKVGVVDFKSLARLSQRKAAQIYKDIITGNVSVADRIN